MAELELQHEDPDEIISVRLYISRRQLALMRGIHAEEKPDLPPGKRTFSAWTRHTQIRPYAELKGKVFPPDPVTAGGYRPGKRKVAK